MAHKRTINDTFIGVNLNDNKYTLFIINAHEVMGHDDSFPYNAFFEVRNNHAKEIISGRVWNDGWGGDSIIDLDNQEQWDEFKTFQDYIENNITFTFRGSEPYKVSIDMLFDTLALLSIGSPKNNGKVFTEQAIRKHLNDE